MKGIKDAQRIVVKVGTSTLTYDTGKVNLRRMDKLAQVISDLRNSGIEVALVTSAAIAVGVVAQLRGYRVGAEHVDSEDLGVALCLLDRVDDLSRRAENRVGLEPVVL